MGFDQYHEPPEELPAATRTFARLCASLTEEAEAIGWYEQRLAVETDPEALAIMRDAQGEEFKHFSMDLEFLLRRTPRGARSRRGSCSSPATSSSTARRPRREAVEGGDSERQRRAEDRLARDRQPEGSAAMNHLLRSLAPISDAGWELLDDEARERLSAGARRAQARRLLRPARLGALGDQPRTRRSALTSAPCDGVTGAAAARAAARRAAGRLRDLARRAPRRRPRRRRRRPRARSTRPRTRSRSPRTSRSSTAGQRRDHRHRRGLAARRDAARRRAPTTTRARSRARSSGCSTAGSAARTGSRSDGEQYRRVVETAEHGGYPLLDHLRKILEGPIVWAPGVDGRGRGQPARRRLPVRVRPGPLDRLRLSHDADAVRLYLEESFSFHVATPEAAVALSE